ncbi:Crp/Fnr family transcriptional regulator [cyanobacterium TDX16]|nr:Crp/Fnr family transcriptional regulator [cyanobacterium TDX16]
MSDSEANELYRKNQLLAALPTEEYQRLLPYLEVVCLSHRQILHEINEPIKYVYFPTQALVSMVSLMEDGATIEVGIVGKDGAVGLPVCWGGNSATTQAIVQIPGSAIRIAADRFKAEFERHEAFYHLILLYTQALFTQVVQTAACNRRHTIEQRLARWLLSVEDRVDAEQLLLTQEFIAQMLGIRRSGVTVAATALQQAGMIRYSRGKIAIVDRQLLQSTACECYKVVKNEFHRLIRSTHDVT